MTRASSHSVRDEPIDRRSIRVRRAAQMFDLSESLIYRAIYNGELRARQLRGRVWLIDPADLEAWIQANSEPNVA